MATAAITGTATPSIREADIVTGGKTIIITLTGDTWVTAGATFDAQRQNIINGLVSAQAEAAGWNAQVKANLAVTTVVRTSNTICTITLSAQAAYNITTRETVTVTIPASALAGAAQIVATPTVNCVQGPATFYVGSGGADTNAGDTWATRRLTIQSAVTSANTAGDVVYVAPGTYRETVTFASSGTVGNVISLIGDYTGANTSGAKGVVRITGSNDDISATRAYGITGSGKNYITVRGFVIDIVTNFPIYPNNCTNWTISGCYIGTTATSNGIYADGASQANHIVENCFINGSTNAGVTFQHSSAVDNAGHIVRGCIVTNQRAEGISANRVGGVSVLNCTVIGGVSSASGIKTANFTGTQTAWTVHNCIIMSFTFGFASGATGEITEDYNTVYLCVNNRSNVTAGANSVTRPPLFDTRWFFEAINGGRLVTPFDLASYSTLVEYNSGTGAPSTDMRGAAQVGSYREWGAIEYDSTLSIAGGGATRVIGSPFIRGLGAV